MSDPLIHENYPDPHHDVYSKTVFGFWIYLLTDFILFGALIATYVVLQSSTFGGPAGSDLFHLHFTLTQTLILLSASFTIGLAGAYTYRENKKAALISLLLTFLLGCSFVVMGHQEFSRFLSQGFSWKNSAFLSAYFTIIGTHLLHILFGLLWIIVLAIPIITHGISPTSIKRITCLRMFWQFLNIVWIFIFTIVYLLGVK